VSILPLEAKKWQNNLNKAFAIDALQKSGLFD